MRARRSQWSDPDQDGGFERFPGRLDKSFLIRDVHGCEDSCIVHAGAWRIRLGQCVLAVYPYPKVIPDFPPTTAWPMRAHAAGPISGASSLSFDSLGLRPELLRAVKEQGYSSPTSVQREAVPAVLGGEDLLAAAQTGTGKTAGFALPLLQRLMETQPPRSRRCPVRALVVVPTRELALQVDESIRTYGAHLPLRSITIFGGVGMGPQIDGLRAGRDIVVATPGRLLDHVSRRTIDLGQVEILVLDEADRMLDMGFIHDIKRIIALLPGRRQSLLFSATFSDSIRTLANRLLNSPRLIEVAPRNSAAELVDQIVYSVDRSRKTDLLVELVHGGAWKQVLVFTRTKHGADRLARKLDREQITAAAIHGNKSQNARTRALASFKQGEVRVLVATDIAARGLDIDGLPHVVNFELPNVAEDYVHRIGRTGRAGASGEAVSLVSAEERPLLSEIEKLLGRRLKARSRATLGWTPVSVSPLPAELAKSRDTGGQRANVTGNVALARTATAPSRKGHLIPARVRDARSGNRVLAAIRGRPGISKERRFGTEEIAMAIGTVKWFNPAKGFGFIAPEGEGKDVFIHISALERGGITGLAEGQKIEYEVGTGRDGRTAAENIRLVD